MVAKKVWIIHGPDVMVSGDIKELDMGIVLESVVEVLVVPFISLGRGNDQGSALGKFEGMRSESRKAEEASSKKEERTRCARYVEGVSLPKRV